MLRKLLLFMSGMLFSTFMLFGQSYLEKTVSLSVSNQTLESVFKSISKQTGVIFSYTSFNDQRRVSYACQQKRLKLVLDDLLLGHCSYKVKDKYIILNCTESLAKKKPTNPKVQVAGWVIDHENEQAIEQVSVYIKSSKHSCLSNSKGFFQLEIPFVNDGILVSFAKFGFVDTTIWVKKASSTSLRIQLKKISNSLPTQITAQEDTLKASEFVQTEPRDSVIESEEKFPTVRIWEQKLIAFLNEKYRKIREDNENLKNIGDTLFSNVSFGLFPPLSTNRLLGYNTVNNVGINLLVGHSKGVRSFEFAGLSNFTFGDVQYVQFAGLSNLVKGDVLGVQFAGLTNVNQGNLDGFQLAGIYNQQVGDLNGFQLGGIANLNVGNFQGFQLGGIANVQTHEMSGMSLAGIVNYTRGKSYGFSLAGITNISEQEQYGMQFSGITSISRGNLYGVQLSGIASVADTVYGLQFAGILNRANVVYGTQFGLVNVARDYQGVPFGFFSYSRKGYHKLELAYDDFQFSTLSLRTGVNAFHNIFIAGVETKKDVPFWTVGYGVGSAIRMSKKLYLGLDVTGQTIQARTSNTWNDALLLGKGFVGLEYRPIEKINFFAGPTWNVLVTDVANTSSWNAISTLSPDWMFDEISGNTQVRMNLGFKVGVRFF